MGRSIPLGAYVSGHTALHDVDARAKLFALLALSVAAFVARTPQALALLVVALVALLRVARIGASALASAVKPTAVVLAFALLANTIVVDGSFDVQIIGYVGIDLDGLARGAVAVLRIVLLVGFVCVVTATTSSADVARSLVCVLRPLARVGVPVGDVAMIVGMALRFLPEAMGEFDRIVLAQRARGARFGEGSVRVRLSRWASVLVPLVVGLFDRADELALAMRDRCYSGAGGMVMERRMGVRDVVLALGSLALAVGCALL